MRQDVGRNVSGGARVVARNPQISKFANELAAERERIARFFVDLRHALRLTLPQIAGHFGVREDAVECLETGQVERLPAHPDTARFIMAYTASGRVDGRPVLAAIGALIAKLQREGQVPAPKPAAAHDRLAGYGGRQLVRAGSVLANGAKRLPKDAIEHMRRRPERAFYAVSLPLGLLLVGLNSSAIANVSRPFASSVGWVSGYFQEYFGRVEGGLRYIEVDDPRSRRADKLAVRGTS